MENKDIARQPDSDPGFQYSDLPDAANHIRLLRVLRAEDGQTVQCDRSVWPKETAPPYNAVSYTWGDPASTTVINMNGKQKTVRTNCEYVLRQAYWCDPSAYIWIDALCINQQNNAEKGPQVAMMGDIYKHADQVLAGVGPHADNSEVLLQVILENEGLYSDIPKQLKAEGTLLRRRLNQVPPRLKRPLLKWIIRYLPAKFEKLAQAHRRFFRRPYFTRVWVVQELFMAKKIALWSGKDQVPFSSLHGYLWVIDQLETLRVQRLRYIIVQSLRDLKFHSFHWSVPPSGKMLIAWLISKRVRRKRTLPLNEDLFLAEVSHEANKEHLPIVELLGRLEGHQCDDRRDMVYATLSLVDWQGAQQIYPDYDKTCFELALEILALDHRADLWDTTQVVHSLQLHGEQLCHDRQKLGTGEPQRGSHHFHDQLISQKIRLLSQKMSIAAAPTHGSILTRHISHTRGSRLVFRAAEPAPRLPALFGVHHTGRPAFLTVGSFGPVLRSAPLQKGDWVFDLFDHRCMVVGRDDAEGRFDLIGYTAFEKDFDYLPDKVYFDVFLDHEDRLMMAILWESLDTLPSGHDSFNDPEMLEMLSRRVCRYKGSSYAKRAAKR